MDVIEHTFGASERSRASGQVGWTGRVDRSGGVAQEIVVGAVGRIAAIEPFLVLEPGRVTGLVGGPGLGLTKIGLALLATRRAGLVACIDTRGWLSPEAAWESGIEPERLVIARCGDPVRWARAAAALLEGVTALYAEVPRGVKEQQLRKLGALARSRDAPIVLRATRGDLPTGVLHMRLEVREVIWEGVERGHGRLGRRTMVVEASGKAMRGMTRRVEMEDDGKNPLRLVPGLASQALGSRTG